MDVKFGTTIRLKLDREMMNFPMGGKPINRGVDRSLVPGLPWAQERKPQVFESPRPDQFYEKVFGNYDLV